MNDEQAITTETPSAEELKTTEKSRIVIQQAFSPDNGTEWMPWIPGPTTDGRGHRIQLTFDVDDEGLAIAVLSMLRDVHADDVKRKFRLVKQISTWVELA